MTIKEAIDTLYIAMAEVEWNYPFDYIDAIEAGIAALNKQIPKKPLDIIIEYNGDYGRCPNCNHTVSDYDDLNICRNCGQKLTWKGD